MIDWSKQDDTKLEIVGKIADRLWDEFNIARDKTTTVMDLMACNMTCLLDFDALLNASRFDFVHDLQGINRHLCHDTGKLKDHFVPRFAKRKESHEPSQSTHPSERRGALHT